MIGAISGKALRRGVTHTAFDIEEIIDSADRKLFTRITQPYYPLFTSSSSSQNLCILPAERTRAQIVLAINPVKHMSYCTSMNEISSFLM